MATGDYHKEKVTGVINGVNKSFSTSANYVSGSLDLWWNGILTKSDDDLTGFTETGTNTFDTSNAPRTNDQLHVRYIEA